MEGSLHQLAVSSGIGLYKERDCIHFVALGNSWLQVATFVLGLGAVVFFLNGLAQLGLALSSGGGLLILGLVLTVVGLVFGYGAWLTWKAGAARQRRPNSALHTLATLDLGARVLRDSSGVVRAPFDQIRFETRFQVTSSSRRLVVCWQGGELSLVNGNPFAGGLSAISDELATHGFRVG